VANFVLGARSRHLIPALLLVGGGQEMSAQSIPDAVGCYRFDRPYFTWFEIDGSPRRVTADSTAVLRLLPDSIITVFGQRARALLPVPAPRDTVERRRWLQVSNWSQPSADSIRVEWRNGFYGPVFRLSGGSDSLIGTVLQTTDVYGPSPPRLEPAHAVRIDCPG
jgi:hypothetical protein